jgi:glycerol-3-phosphate dehydrogenase (NAD(P)+)
LFVCSRARKTGLEKKNNNRITGIKRIGILGAGSWGTALAILLQKNGHQVRMWEFDRSAADRLLRDRENLAFLPGVPIPVSIGIGSDLDAVIHEQDVLFFVIPSHVMRSVGERVANRLKSKPLVVSCSKGIENDTLLRMSEVLLETIPSLSPESVVVLSGPSHAEEVAQGIPTVVTAASIDAESGRLIQDVLKSPAFRVYTNPDVIGVELGGALKNVIAVAAGISDGAGCGDNTKAALLTRGIVEITRLGVAMGANPMTFAGLSGIGDLIVTCTSRHSRNRYVGEQIGRGRSLHEVLESMIMVAEGVRTTRSVMDLSTRYKVEMPITREVYRVLFENKPPKEALKDLMTRNPKMEDWA